MSGDSTASLVRMVNQIASNLVHEPDPVAAVAEHVEAFWSGRMRAQIAAWLAEHGTDGLDPIAFAALVSLQQGADAG